MNFVVTFDDQASFAAAKCVTYIEGSATSVAVALDLEGGNIVTCAKEITKFRSQK